MYEPMSNNRMTQANIDSAIDATLVTTITSLSLVSFNEIMTSAGLFIACLVGIGRLALIVKDWRRK